MFGRRLLCARCALPPDARPGGGAGGGGRKGGRASNGQTKGKDPHPPPPPPRRYETMFGRRLLCARCALPPEARPMTEDLTRRRLLGMAGATAAGAAGLGLGACTSDSKHVSIHTAAEASSGPPFVSRPDLTTPHLRMKPHGVPNHPRYVFLNAPWSGPGHGGSYIVDHHSRLIWFGPNTSVHRRMNFDVQMLHGEPKLTWFQGMVVQG